MTRFLPLCSLLAGCSLLRVQPAVCTADVDCRDAFGPTYRCAEDGYCAIWNCTASSECRETLGFGWSCGEDTLCAEWTPHPRCTSEPASVLADPVRHVDDIVLGSVFDKADFAIMNRAARLAVIEVNRRDGLAGIQYGMVQCTNEPLPEVDELDDVEATVATANWLVDIGVEAIVGPATSGRAEAMYNAIAPADTLMVTPSATSPALTDLDGLAPNDQNPGLLWRTAPPDSLQGRVIAQWMRDELLAERAAVIAQTGPYGEGLAQVFLDNFTGGGEITELHLFSDTTQLVDALTQVGSGNWQQVLVISSQTSDVVNFMNAAAQLPGYDDKGIFLTDGARDSQLIEDTGTATSLYDQVHGTVPAFFENTTYQTFQSSYIAEYEGEDPRAFGFAPHAYDAAWLTIYGSAWAHFQEDTVTGRNMARGLRRLSGAGDELNPVAWNTVKANFEAGLTVNIVGASGKLDYDPVTEETTAPIYVWKIAATNDAFEFEDIACVDLAPGQSSCPE